MKHEKLKKLPQIKDEKELNDLEVGDYFLYGQAMINQIDQKKQGQDISYYQVIHKEGVNIEFGMVFDILE